MTRKSITVYNYRDVPEKLPPSKHTATPIDKLDGDIERYWNEDIRKLMQPIGHPQSKRFFIQQYQAALLIQARASTAGDTSTSEMDVWRLMTILRRVADRRSISPRRLLVSTRIAAE